MLFHILFPGYRRRPLSYPASWAKMYDRDLSLTQSAAGVVVATMSARTMLQSFLFPEYIFLGVEYLVDSVLLSISVTQINLLDS